MRTRTDAAGFALLLVFWTLVILSSIALTLAASVGTEVRTSQDSWNDLQVERLAESGHEMATYLETRALGTAAEDLAALPVEAMIPGLKYRIGLDDGTVDIVLEGENGKLDLAAASEEDAASFFRVWTGDPNRSREIAASVADWMDTNDEPRPFGAESASYLSLGYRPRNAGLGAADLFLVKGLTGEDFNPTLITSEGRSAIRSPLGRVISTLPTGKAVNPNYALPVVLKSLPSMTQVLLARILEMRQRSIFTSTKDFQEKTGLATDSPLLTHLEFSRGTAPAILATAWIHESTRIRTERRVRAQSIDPRRRVPIRFVSLIERRVPGE